MLLFIVLHVYIISSALFLSLSLLHVGVTENHMSRDITNTNQSDQGLHCELNV